MNSLCANGGSHGRRSWYPPADLSHPSLVEQLNPAFTWFCHSLCAMLCAHTTPECCSIAAFPGDSPGSGQVLTLCPAGAECREQAGPALWHVLQLWEAVARDPDPGGWDQRPGGNSLIALARLLQLFLTTRGSVLFIGFNWPKSTYWITWHNLICYLCVVKYMNFFGIHLEEPFIWCCKAMHWCSIKSIMPMLKSVSLIIYILKCLSCIKFYYLWYCKIC